MIKLNTKITLLVCSVVAAILLLNQYPVSMSLKQTVLDAGGSALRDITYQLAHSPELREGLARGDTTKIEALAIVDESFAVRYNSPTNGIEPPILESFRAVLPQGDEPEVITKNSKIPVTYAFSAIYSEGGARLGGIVAKLQHEQNQAGLQKAQRDLNAMTMLVMLIAMIFAWELTDKIKGDNVQFGAGGDCPAAGGAKRFD